MPNINVGNLTFALIKPAVGKIRRAILKEIGKRGYRIVAQRTVELTADEARGFYRSQREMPRFDEMAEYMASGSVIALILEKANAVRSWRKDIGSVVRSRRQPGTIRAMYSGKGSYQNAVHGSATMAEAIASISLFFPEFKQEHFAAFEGIEGPIKLQALWNHITTWKKPTPCMRAIHAGLMEHFAQSPVEGENYRSLRGLMRLQARITKTTNVDGKRIVSGEWTITNRDLEFFHDLNFFGRRDYFPDTWHYLSNGLGACLTAKRKYQVEVEFKRTGILPEHLAMLSRCYWEADYFRGDWVSIFVEGKRPLGDSGRALAMFSAVGWPKTWRGEKMPQKVEERLWVLFDQLPLVLAETFKKHEIEDEI